MSSKDNRKKGADIETDVEMKDKNEKKRRRRANQQEEGPGPRRPLNAHDLKNLGQNSKKTIKRLSAMFKPYKWHMARGVPWHNHQRPGGYKRAACSQRPLSTTT